MNTLIERLRNIYEWHAHDTACQAADELERQAKEIEGLRAVAQQAYTAMTDNWSTEAEMNQFHERQSLAIAALHKVLVFS